jgi:hypothetical protein
MHPRQDLPTADTHTAINQNFRQNPGGQGGNFAMLEGSQLARRIGQDLCPYRERSEQQRNRENQSESGRARH